jgi:hypothetical protein
MVTRMLTSRSGRNAHVAAFLCGTFALALGLVLVLDPEDDDDSPVLISTTASTESQPTAGSASASKQLKVAKTQKLKPKKTAFKKRGKRVFNLTESAPPAPGGQRPRRGFAQAPALIIPAPSAGLDLPATTPTRLQPGTSPRPHASPQLRPQLTRGPPLRIHA